MSIFGSIMSKIFNHPAAASEPPAAGPSATDPGAPPASALAPTDATAPTAAAPPAQPVDVDAVLSDLASKNPQPLNYKTSIVDLMKLLDLDSSLQSRTELAKELKFTGDTNDSASMNVWLHKEVMQKLEENGGKVPADLKG